MHFNLLLKSYFIVLMLFITGCDFNSDTNYDSGYNDGYAEGFNTTCEIRKTLVKGDWDNKDYSMGYKNGRVVGANACREHQKTRKPNQTYN